MSAHMSASHDGGEDEIPQLPAIDPKSLFTAINTLMFPEILEKRGLFRIVGRRVIVDQLVASLHRHDPDFSEAQPFEIASGLKRYMEETQPLLPYDLFEVILQTQQIALPSQRGPALLSVLSELKSDPMIGDLLNLVVSLCRGILDAAAKNNMEINALCRIFGPLVLRPDPSEPRIDPNLRKSVASFMKDVLRWYEYLFEGKKLNLEGADKTWQRKRKRKTMQLLDSVKKQQGSSMPDASNFFIIDPKQPLSVAQPKRERVGFVHHTTYLASFGAMSARRTYSDFSTLHFFLVQNYPKLAFPNLPPKARLSADEMAPLLTAFLAYVCTQDELFMDSLFTNRFSQFFAAKGSDGPDDAEAPVSPRHDSSAQLLTKSSSSSSSQLTPKSSSSSSSLLTPKSPASPSSSSSSSSVAGASPISIGSSGPQVSPAGAMAGKGRHEKKSDRTKSKQFQFDEVLLAEQAPSTDAEKKKQEREKRLAEARRKREQRLPISFS